LQIDNRLPGSGSINASSSTPAPPYTSPKYMSTQHEIMPLIFHGMSNGKAGSAGYHASLPLW
jgi:hypothetical protein